MGTEMAASCRGAVCIFGRSSKTRFLAFCRHRAPAEELPPSELAHSKWRFSARSMYLKDPTHVMLIVERDMFGSQEGARVPRP